VRSLYPHRVLALTWNGTHIIAVVPHVYEVPCVKIAAAHFNLCSLSDLLLIFQGLMFIFNSFTSIF